MAQDNTHNRSYFLNAGEEEKSIFLSTLCTLANADGKIKDFDAAPWGWQWRGGMRPPPPTFKKKNI